MNNDSTIPQCKPSDLWLMKIWNYMFLPLIPSTFVWLSFFDNSAPGSLNGEQFFLVSVSLALIFGLHKKMKWAWYLNWVAILPIAAIPLKFGAIGGAIGGLWIWWNFTAWKRLKSNFT
jgi:hypothetical protein